MSCKCKNRMVWDAKLKQAVDAGERILILSNSPHRKHRKEYMEYTRTVANIQDMIATAQKEAQDEAAVQV